MSHKRNKDSFEGKWYAHPPMRNGLIAGVITLFTFGLRHTGLIPGWAEIGLFCVAIGIGGFHWAWEGVEELVECKEIGIEILMMAATIGSMILGMWDEAAFLVVIYAIAEGLEEFAYAHARASVRHLLDLAPKEARLLRNKKETTIPATELRVGDIFVVKPGESIATDGIIVKGQSTVNEAPVTGESVPVEKKVGMPVFAATFNQEGALEIQVTASFADNTLAKIIHLVEEAQDKKGKTQLFIEKFGKYYSPTVLVAALGMVAGSFLFGPHFANWGTRAVVLLVAAAPCALIMSTPVAVAAGIGRAGKEGVLIKGGAYLEQLGKIQAIAFDKTGTITKGAPAVTDILPITKTEKEIMCLAYSVERLSEHPLARAIVKYAETAGVCGHDTSNFKAIVGAGTTAQVEKQTVYVGKPELFISAKHFPAQKIRELEDEGKTIMLVGNTEDVYGLVALQDEIRPEAQEVIARLHGMGIRMIMLTGDNPAISKRIAEKLGIDEVHANLRPEDKIAAVKQLKKQFGYVAMIGDGINDAPALAEAGVGIAMGTIGTDAAIEAADVALMADDLRNIPYALDLGRRAKKISQQNIIFSILLLIILIPSALLGWISVAIAVIVHEGSELLAVANGLRIAKQVKN